MSESQATAPSLPLVPDPDQVTPEWLSQVLRASGDLPSGRVVGFRYEAVGTGQVGRNIRFQLDLEDAPESAPRSLVAKFASEDPASRATGVAQQTYWKEVHFYRELVGSVKIRTPRCLFTEIAGPASADFVLVMEDLAPARQGDQVRGCSVEEAALALEELARLHAPRWNDPALDSIEWLGHPRPEAAQLLKAFYSSVFPGFARRYAERLAPDHLALAERLGRGVDEWMRSAEGPLALTHGDYRLDNMLFGTAEGGYPLAVVDWQTPAQGYAASDASYFLGAGLLTEDRRVNERALLRHYHDHLRAEGVTGYSFERCFEDYRRFAFSGVVMAVVASMLVGQSARGDDMFMAMASRHCAHALDLDAEDFLPRAGSQSIT